MEKVIKSVQTAGLSGMKKSKINEIKIMGMSLPVYIIAAFVILYAAMTGILPENMVGALAIMMVLGSALNLMGNKIPIIRSYLGGGAVFCIFASSALATFGILPTAAVQWSQFVMKNFTSALLAGIGIALLDLKVLGAALTPEFMLITVVIILTVALCAGLFGKFVGFYPVEAAITAGLCTNSMGGTGNITVLSASDRMGLIPFAQMATRLGGALVLISASFLITILG